MTKPETPPTPPATPPGSPGEPTDDDKRIGDLVEARVRQAFADLMKTPPATPPAAPKPGDAPTPPAAPSDSGGGLAGAIEAAVARAMEQRDRDDALAVLADEITELRAKITAAPAERKRGWGAVLLGPGLNRR